MENNVLLKVTNWCKANKLAALNIAVLIFQLLQIRYNSEHIRFIPFLIDGVFTLFSFGTGFFLLFFLLFRRNVMLALLFGQIFGGILMFILWKRHLDIYYIINSTLDNILIRPIWPVEFMTAAIQGGSQLWSFMLSLYAGIILLIYGNWFVKNRKLKDGYWKIERQVIWTGLGVYGIINIVIWIFTHFSFVGSNYIYIENMTKYVDKIVVQYDEADQKDLFILKDLKYFKTLDEIKTYYNDPLFLEKTGGVDRKAFHDGIMKSVDFLEKNGFSLRNDVDYDNMKRFHDWMSVVFNMRYFDSDEAKRTLWVLELSPVIRIDPKYQDVTRHSLFYIKQRDNGDYYVYYVYDRAFKDFKQNYIFNLFFGLFHIVFLPLFGYLIFIHRRSNLQKSAIVNENYKKEIDDRSDKNV